MEPSELNIDWQDGKKRVLILGNGLSRRNYYDFINEWAGEVWGCNWVYKELLNNDIHRLDALIGDYQCLKHAIKYKDKELSDTTIYGKAPKTIDLGRVYYPDGFNNQFSDSGTTFVVHALENGYDEIYLVGFDIGGKDLYQHRHHLRNKKSWLRGWRKIAQNHGLQNIYFIGYDHKQIILSEVPDDYYARQYMRGRDHLSSYYNDNTKMDPEYKERVHNQKNEKRSNKVLILGNGKSRGSPDVLRFIKTWQGEIWGCNDIYTEYKQLPRLDRVGVQYERVLNNVAMELLNEGHDLYKIYSNIVTEGYPFPIYLFQDRRDYLTGPQMVLQALYEGYEDIYLAGFDCGGVDYYNRKTRYTQSMITQMKEILIQNGINRFHFLKGVPKVLL